MNPILICSFSGGRTSAYMAKWLLDNFSGIYEIYFVFANTGLEHPKTYEFIHRCDQEWGLNLVWLEAVVHHGERKACTHKIVTYETATRGPAIFEEMVKDYGIPNKAWPHCSRELKEHPILSWKRDSGFAGEKYAIGIRADEIDRMSVKAKERNIIYPLISMKPTTKPEIMHWWKEQPFDLEVPEHYGNCETCWKKSPRKQLTIAKHTPEKYQAFAMMEEKYPNAGRGEDSRQFNSGARFGKETISILEIIELAKTTEFNEFVEHFPEYQLDLLGFDRSDGCSGSCEVFAA